ncbi:MAG: sigma-70 family RNA polymerase sigma factor [Parcubacteria group bacterium]|jgi:RNA polymerase sigma-70 factor (ECF subfamily)
MIHSNESTDKELVEAAKADPDAFARIVDRYWHRLFCYTRRLTYFSQEDIEDVLQEVFIKVYRFLNDYDESFAFSTWIYQITRNTVIDEIRKKKSRPQAVQLDTEEMMTVLRSSMDVEKEVHVKESMHDLQKAIDQVPFKYREILTLRFLEEKDYNEIMDIMQIPKGTVASLINRGRKIFLEEAHKYDII